MKLIHYNIDTPFPFEENSFFGIVIENKSFFYTLLSELYNQINGNKGNFVLSKNDKPIDISKNLELIQHFVPFETNKKTLLTKINSYLEKLALNESNYEKTQRLIAYIESYIIDLTCDCSTDIECTKLNLSSILKSVGIAVCDEEYTLPEKVLNYMELVREFDRDKVFVFVNMKSYFSTEDLNSFISTALSHKFKFIMLDAYDSQRLLNEKRVIIDEDLCEI